MTSSAASWGIGIDTGGTYTDAVLVELGSGRVLAKAKAKTTHRDLAVGIRSAIEQVLGAASIHAADIGLIALSTTLATNAVVENRGAAVGLLVIGPIPPQQFPAAAVKYIKGGHKLNGKEEDPLDVAAVAAAVEDLKNEVEAYAICAAMSVVNPSHELVAQKAIHLLDDQPSFCSHQLSGQFGMAERAATAAFNARLTPTMTAFLEAVSNAFHALGLTAQLQVVRGDATAMSMDEAAQRSAFTIASGPAASALFGAKLSPMDDALVVDVGGTTTDVALITDRKPHLCAEGSLVGSVQTHIHAVETFTVGIGGDSLVRVDYEHPHVGPARVVPLALAPALGELSHWYDYEHQTEFLALNAESVPEPFASSPIVELLDRRGPLTPQQLAADLALPASERQGQLERLHQAQVVDVIGFTPTDALHARGKLDIGDRAQAIAGARALAVRCQQSGDELCQRVLRHTERSIEDAILNHAIAREMGFSLTNFLARRRSSPLLRIDISLNVPLVGLGAASRYFLDNVAQSLGVQATFPDHYDVGNALGALLMAQAVSG